MKARRLGSLIVSAAIVIGCVSYAIVQSTRSPDDALIHAALALFTASVGVMVNMAAWSDIPNDTARAVEDQDDY